MGRAWDDAVDREFVQRLRKAAQDVINSHGDRDDAYRNGMKYFGQVVWNEIYSTYGLDEPPDKDDDDEVDDV